MVYFSVGKFDYLVVLYQNGSVMAMLMQSMAMARKLVFWRSSLLYFSRQFEATVADQIVRWFKLYGDDDLTPNPFWGDDDGDDLIVMIVDR